MDFFVVFCKLSAFLFLQDTKDELAAVSKNKHKKISFVISSAVIFNFTPHKIFCCFFSFKNPEKQTEA